MTSVDNNIPAREWINQMEPWFGQEEKLALMKYMDSGGWLTEYRKTSEFARMIADYIGSRHCIVLSNGTVTLFTALVALGIEPEDEVIVPDFTMIASANAVVLAGAKPVFVDISPSNLCLDLDLVEQAITPRTKAIMLVSLNGRSPDMHRAVELAEQHELYLVEDAAQSLGSRYKGRHLGTFGHIGSFSFSAPKVITTGQGGALITDDAKLADSIRKIKDFGRRQSGVDFHETLGYNFKFTDLQAVVGIEQMRKLDWRVVRKKEMFALYRRELADVPQVEFIETDLENTSPWFIDVLVPDPQSLAAFLKERGIGARPFYPPIHSQPPYGISGSFPVSGDISAHGLWLPSSSFLRDEDILRICSEIRASFRAS
jgi:perosamine synthetase